MEFHKYIPRKMIYLNCDTENPSVQQKYFAGKILDFSQKRAKSTRFGDNRVMKAYAEVNRN